MTVGSWEKFEEGYLESFGGRKGRGIWYNSDSIKIIVLESKRYPSYIQNTRNCNLFYTSRKANKEQE